jgi:hypothetical protein
VKINTTETWLSLLDAHIEKKAKKNMDGKREQSNKVHELSLQVEKLKAENNLLQEKLNSFKEMDAALGDIHDMAMAFTHSLTIILEKQEKNDYFLQRLEKLEKEVAEKPLPIKPHENEYVTRDVFFEELEKIKSELYEKIIELHNTVLRDKGESNAEKKGVRRRITPDINKE